MRIAIVNDVPLAVEALRRVVTSVPAYRVAWIAADGEQAVRACADDVPDVILMDLIMPHMDGVEATRRIMRESPCPILIVTATVEGNTGKVFEAMGWGALDAVDTPVLTMSGDPSGGRALLAKIATLGKLAGRGGGATEASFRGFDQERKTTDPTLVAIGASTGGPAALVQVLEGIPRGLHISVSIVQHIDEHFAPDLARWLASKTGHEVVPIRSHDRPVSGTVMIGATNDHLVLTRNGTYGYTPNPKEFLYRPSVDVFFQSLVEFYPGPVVGVLLTGMGSDGAEGLLGLRRAGWHTIAQDESTSLVYGMPKAAARLNAAIQVLALQNIAPAILQALRIQDIQQSTT